MGRGRGSVGGPFLRLRSDEQLVDLFRAGHEEAFRVIHDRYRARLFAYTRQMLPGSRQDAEDALQDVFIRAYGGLRANNRHLALRAWLYRIAHNRCVDQLRKNLPVPAEEIEATSREVSTDPIAAVEQREMLEKLVIDVQRLPEQQRSALLLREMSGMSYQELAESLELSVPAIKSLLVRARTGLTAAAEAREASCHAIRDELVLCHDRGVRPNALARRHLKDCAGCREFREEVRSVSSSLAALVPALGPLAIVAKLLGLGGVATTGTSFGGGAAAAGGAAATGAGATATGAAATGVAATSVAAGTGAAAAAGSAAVGGAAAGGAAVGGAAVGGVAAGGAAAGGVAATSAVAVTGAAATGAAATGAAATVGAGITASHVATILAAAVIAGGGAVAATKIPSGPSRPHIYTPANASPAAAPAAAALSRAAHNGASGAYSAGGLVVPLTQASAPTTVAGAIQPAATSTAAATTPASTVAATTTAVGASTSTTAATTTPDTTGVLGSAVTGTTPAVVSPVAASPAVATAASASTVPTSTAVGTSTAVSATTPTKSSGTTTSTGKATGTSGKSASTKVGGTGAKSGRTTPTGSGGSGVAATVSPSTGASAAGTDETPVDPAAGSGSTN